MRKLLNLLVLAYFRFFAVLKLKQNPQAILVGITGTAGKTSTRLALARILATHGIVKHSAHANSESGLSLNILGLTPRNYSLLDWVRLAVWAPFRLLIHEHFRYYVAEMGIDSPFSPKNMAYLLTIVRPHLAIILSVGLTHAAAFDPLIKDRDSIRRAAKIKALIAQEKFKLASSLPTTGTAVVNLDQPEFVPLLKKLRCRRLTFGYSPRADLRILSTQTSRVGFRLKFSYQNQSHNLILPDPLPAHFAHTFAAAIAAAAALGIPPAQSIPPLLTYRSPAGRLRLFPGLYGSQILDSSYNSSPSSLSEALQLLKKLGGRSQKLAVIGDMRELGVSSKLAHKQLADQIYSCATEAILFGPQTAEFVLPVLKRRHFPVHHFDRMQSLIQFLHTRLTTQTWVLFKGSQNQIFLERAVESVLANPADASQLCRRGSYWDKIRAKTP